MALATHTSGANGVAGLANGLHHIVEEAERLLVTAADSGDARFDEVRDKVSAQVREMRAQLEELQDSAVARTRRAARRADLAAHEHPYGAMGVAAAVGLLIGFLATRGR